MLTIEKAVLMSPEQMQMIIEGDAQPEELLGSLGQRYRAH